MKQVPILKKEHFVQLVHILLQSLFMNPPNSNSYDAPSETPLGEAKIAFLRISVASSQNWINEK